MDSKRITVTITLRLTIHVSFLNSTFQIPPNLIKHKYFNPKVTVLLFPEVCIFVGSIEYVSAKLTL